MTTPSPSPVNLLNEAGPLDARLAQLVERMAAALKKDGDVGRINIDGADYWLHRMPHGVYRLTTTPGERPAAKDGSWGPPLWELLSRGAETPDGRRALAESMTAKLPCGPCKKNWPEALKGLTEEHLATPEAFHRWVWARRQEIAKSKGKEVWEYPGLSPYPH